MSSHSQVHRSVTCQRAYCTSPLSPPPPGVAIHGLEIKGWTVFRRGFNVIPRLARPGLAGLRPHSWGSGGLGYRLEGLGCRDERKAHSKCYMSAGVLYFSTITPPTWGCDSGLGLRGRTVFRRGSNVIQRRARPGLAGLGPHSWGAGGVGYRLEGLGCRDERKAHSKCYMSAGVLYFSTITPPTWGCDSGVRAQGLGSGGSGYRLEG